MKSILNEQYNKLSFSAENEISKIVAGIDDLLDISIGDPDITTPSEILEPAIEDARNGHTKYTDSRGSKELRDSIANMYKEDYNIDVADDEIMVTTSACAAMYVVLQSMLDKGDEVVIIEPYFFPYSDQVKMAGGVPVYLKSYEEEDFQINFDRLSGVVTDKTKAIIINTPCNPTGNCLSLETMQGLAKFAKDHGIYIIADDIYTIFAYQGEFIPILSLEGMKDYVVTVNSFSKNYIMTGFRIGNVIAPPQFVKVMQFINDNINYSAPSISQRAAIHGIKQRHAIKEKIVSEFKKRIFYAADRINGINNMSTLSPKGTFYLFINIKKTGLTSKQVQLEILKQAHVMTMPGSLFGDSGEGYLRISCTVSVDTLKEAFDRIAKMDIFQ